MQWVVEDNLPKQKTVSYSPARSPQWHICCCCGRLLRLLLQYKCFTECCLQDMSAAVRATSNGAAASSF